MHDGDPHAPLSQDEADALFDVDVMSRVDAANRLVTVQLTQNMFDVIVSAIYNAGEGAIASSMFLRYINAEMYADACVEWLTWRKAGGKSVEGLLNRRAHEVLVFARSDYE